MSGELKKLAAPEAAQVFEEVRAIIMSKGAFDSSPSGADGLAVLVTAHPSLEPSLLKRVC